MTKQKLRFPFYSHMNDDLL